MQTVAGVQELLHRGEHARMPFQVDEDLLTITNLEGEAIVAGLHPGDRLLELRGQPYRGRRQLLALRGGANYVHAGQPIDVVVRRSNGSTQRMRIHTVARGASVTHFNAEWTLGIVTTLPPLICLLIGYWVCAARIRDPNAWLLLVLFATPSCIVTQPNWWPGVWGVGLSAWYELLQLLAAPLLLLFGIYFPERWRVDRRYPWLKRLILAPTLLCFGLFAAIFVIEYFAAPELGTWSARASVWFGRLLNPLNLLCVLVYVAALADKLRSATSADGRRRMRVLAAGSLIGLGSLLIVFVLLPHFGLEPGKRPGIVILRTTSSFSPRPSPSPMWYWCSARWTSASCSAWAPATPSPGPRWSRWRSPSSPSSFSLPAAHL